MTSFIRFEPLPTPAGLTTHRVAIVSARYGDYLGTIAWYGRWRQYCLEPAFDTIWSDGCLADVKAKVSELNQAQRDVALARRAGVARPAPRLLSADEFDGLDAR